MKEFFRLFRHFNIVFKVAAIGLLALLLLIPLKMVNSILQERLNRRTEAIKEINANWGPSQTIVGPVLVVPYLYTWKAKEPDPEKKDTLVEITKSGTVNTYFLPDDLQVTGTVEPVIRKRGIYEAILYRADLKLEGTFINPDPNQFKLEQDGKALWDQAYVAVAVSDLRGVDNALKIKINEQEFTLLPGAELKGFSSGIHANIKGAGVGKPINFSFNLAVNGSGALNFAPVALRQQVNVKSSWASPSFGGAILPKNSQIASGGFNANWEVSYYGRKYPQAWTQVSTGEVLSEHTASDAQFGVRLLSSVDQYRSVERAIKYGILFILLIFMVFFLFELVTKIRVHVFQYILVGAALCIFYLALLSLSELISFGASYLTAAVACTLMISLYSLNILRSGVRTVILGLGLFLTYGFLYVILQMEDYSLIAGTVGLFIALGAVMYATRHVNWYGEESQAIDPSLKV